MDLEIDLQFAMDWKGWQEGWRYMWESSTDARSSAVGWVTSERRACGSGLGGKPTWVMLWVSATDCLARKKWSRSSSDNWKKPHIHWPWLSLGLEPQRYLLVCIDNSWLRSQWWEVLCSCHSYKQGRAGWGCEGWEQCWLHYDGGVQELEGREQGKNQDYHPGLQQKTLVLCQRSAWNNPMWYDPAEKRGPGELVDSQGSPPPYSGVVHPDGQEIKPRQ